MYIHSMYLFSHGFPNDIHEAKAHPKASSAIRNKEPTSVESAQRTYSSKGTYRLFLEFSAMKEKSDSLFS